MHLDFLLAVLRQILNRTDIHLIVVRCLRHYSDRLVMSMFGSLGDTTCAGSFNLDIGS